MSTFAAGLLIYYSWSNLLTILQQYVIMRRFKVENPIDDIIATATYTNVRKILRSELEPER